MTFISKLVTLHDLYNREQTLLDRVLPANSLFSVCARVFNSFHFMTLNWRYMDEATANPLAYGSGVALYAIGGKLNERVAQIILISQTLSECIAENQKLSDEAARIKNAFFGTAPQEYINQNVEAEGQNPLDSRAAIARSQNMVPQPAMSLTFRVQEIARALFLSLKQMLVVSHKMLELFEAFMYDKHTAFRAQTGMFNNLSNLFKSFQENKDSLQKYLKNKKNAETVNDAVEKIDGDSASFDAFSLLAALDAPMQKIQNIAEGAQETVTNGLAAIVGMGTGELPTFTAKERELEPENIPQKRIHTSAQSVTLGSTGFRSKRRALCKLEDLASMDKPLFMPETRQGVSAISS